MYQYSAQLLSWAQATDATLKAGTAHVRLSRGLPISVTARAELWSEVLSLVRLQAVAAHHAAAESHASPSSPRADALSPRSGRPFSPHVSSQALNLLVQQNIVSHVMDSKALELCIDVLLANTRAVHITVMH